MSDCQTCKDKERMIKTLKSLLDDAEKTKNAWWHSSEIWRQKYQGLPTTNQSKKPRPNHLQPCYQTGLTLQIGGH